FSLFLIITTITITTTLIFKSKPEKSEILLSKKDSNNLIKKTKKIESKPKEDEIEKIDDSNIDYEIKSEQPINDINSKLPLENEHINNSQLKEDTNISNKLDILKTENEKSEDLTNNKINEQSQLETAEPDKKIKKKQVIFILGHEQDNIMLEYNPDDIEKTFNLPVVPIVDKFDFIGWKYKNSDKNFLKPEQDELDIIKIEAVYKQYWTISYNLNGAAFIDESYFPKKYYKDNREKQLRKIFDNLVVKKKLSTDYGEIRFITINNELNYIDFNQKFPNLENLTAEVVIKKKEVRFKLFTKFENKDGTINDTFSDNENEPYDYNTPTHKGIEGERISIKTYQEGIDKEFVWPTCNGCFERKWYKIIINNQDEYTREEFEKNLEKKFTSS
ncbi:hypothetical protein, partial [Mycoplasmopsis cricetuli]|uniref:hypothetical protein n=1 Tax=Mycoplasmopsis cricetuli TaxID=171283 RepID=UPI00055A3982